jgi:hypothetical protein
VSTTDEQVKERTGDYNRFLQEQAAYVESLLRCADDPQAVAIANAIRVGCTEIAATIKNASYVMKHRSGQ